MNGSTQLAAEFVSHADAKLGEFAAQVRRCAAQLDESELWNRAHPAANSIGNLVLHLAGNVRQWILGGLDGRPVCRDRAAEFAACGPQSAEEILETLARVVDEARQVIRGLTAADLERRHVIQEYDVCGLVAVFHVVEHFAGHTAKIAHMTRVLRGTAPSRYDAAGHKLPGLGAEP